VSKKLFIGLGALALVIASAVGYRCVTGQCPVGALMHKLHGDAQATTTVQP
jgi:hypothetical protein